jgi:hypothetical protein
MRTCLLRAIEKSADISASGGEYGDALQVALVEAYEEIVKLLLEKGVQPGRYMSHIVANMPRFGYDSQDHIFQLGRTS